MKELVQLLFNPKNFSYLSGFKETAEALQENAKLKPEVLKSTDAHIATLRKEYDDTVEALEWVFPLIPAPFRTNATPTEFVNFGLAFLDALRLFSLLFKGEVIPADE